MLVNPHSENQDEPHEHEPQQQKYETMQCFAVSEPKSIKEEGDGMEGEGGKVCKKGVGKSFDIEVVTLQNNYYFYMLKLVLHNPNFICHALQKF